MAISITHTYIVHSVPGACALVLMVISNTVLIRRHCVYLLYFGMIYSASNYYATLKKGEPLYWFLTWED